MNAKIWTEIELLLPLCHRGTEKEEAAFKRLVDRIDEMVGSPAENPSRSRQRLIAIVSAPVASTRTAPKHLPPANTTTGQHQ
jgi:hypothetical protein